MLTLPLVQMLITAAVFGAIFSVACLPISRFRWAAPFGLIPISALVLAFGVAWLAVLTVGSRFGEKGELLGGFLGLHVGALFGAVLGYLGARAIRRRCA
ncbi:MAG TPA: hypothetical protein VFV54_11185 [Thermoanaerobaculia bacterium]|nr:hypothetical protein [Thermoanaerobaculia bacterium]